MDFHQFLLLAVVLVGIGYLIGSRESKVDQHGLPTVTTPDNHADVINNLRGHIAAQQTAMQKWVDAARELGFDGVAAALDSIKARRNITVNIRADTTTMQNDMSKVVSMINRPRQIMADTTLGRRQ